MCIGEGGYGIHLNQIFHALLHLNRNLQALLSSLKSALWRALHIDGGHEAPLEQSLWVGRLVVTVQLPAEEVHPEAPGAGGMGWRDWGPHWGPTLVLVAAGYCQGDWALWRWRGSREQIRWWGRPVGPPLLWTDLSEPQHWGGREGREREGSGG